MYYLVCYKLETAIAIDEEVDPTNLSSVRSPHLKKFLKKVGKHPITKIDSMYPSYGAVIDNFHIIEKA